MSSIASLLLALVIIGLIIFMHELGHYLAARLTGISVVEFAMGFGPRLISWRRGRTNYSVRLLLVLGGFCKFAGEDETEHWYTVPYVTGLTEHSPALASGIKPGDVITRVGDTDIAFDAGGTNTLLDMVRENGPTPMRVTVKRDGMPEPIALMIRPQMINGEPQLGVILGRVDDAAMPRVVHAEDGSQFLPGDLIVRVGRRYIEYASSGAMTVNRLIEQSNGKPLRFVVEREGRMLTLTCAPGTLVLGNANYELPGESKEAPAVLAFNKQPVYKRMLTVFAGPFMNFVLAYVAGVALFLSLVLYQTVPLVADLTPGLNAEAAGMRPGDLIVQAAGEYIENSEAGALKLREIIAAADPDQSITFLVDRGSERLPITVTPTETPSGHQIGIVMGRPYHLTLGQAMRESLHAVGRASTVIVDALRAMVTTGEGLDQTAGPVGLVTIMTAQAQRGDFEIILNMLMLISINLGIMNLLPLPALDGGRLAFMIVEGVRRKPVKPEHEAWVHVVGLMLFMALFVVLTYRDIARLVTGGGFAP